VSSVTFGVLGPLIAVRETVPADLKGPRQRSVLARLVIAKGRVVPMPRLIDDLWPDEPPENAAGTIQTFVFSLRRALEPDRPSRTPARLLVTSAPGYALRAAPGSVDAWRFETAVAGSGDLLAAGDARAALSSLDEALALWRGPAYAEFAGQAWARAEIDRLDGLRLLAVERRAEAALTLGRAADIVPGLEAHVIAQPWRETAWRLLALALYRTGRQGDALGALRRARKILAAELGVDPGPELRQLEADVLAQAPHLAAPVAQDVADVVAGASDEQPFVGRGEELDQLQAAATTARTHRKLVLVLVSGDAGSGKTTLAEALTSQLTAEGWTTAWGRSPEHDGAPAAWPWTQLLTTLTAPAADMSDGSATARFRMHQAVSSHLAATAARSPLLLVLDDLHWAGEETLALLTHLVAEPGTGPVLIVGTYRTTEISAGLTAALGHVARAKPARIYLGGLSEAAVGDLLRAVSYHDISPGLARAVHRRAGGNPFFVSELARLLDAEGSAGLSSVPAGVRDVVRHRVAALPDTVATILRQAAVLGRDVDLDLLVPLSGDEDEALDAVESALLAGFLVEDADGPIRFSHALVRDTLYDDIPRMRRTRWHATVAETLERLRPDDSGSLAHHFLRAESHSTAGRAAHYARAAAEHAERRFAPHEALRLWRDAIAAHDRSGVDDPRARLESVMGMVRALAVTGGLEAARRYRAEAITSAEKLGDPALTARVITAFDVPAIWTSNDDPVLSRDVVDSAERTLAALSAHQAEQRCRLLSTIALELRGAPGERGRQAAVEAEALARRLDDPALLAFALNARFMHTFSRAGLAPERARAGAELVDLAARHDLVTFEVLGHLIELQAHSALADFAAADDHAKAAHELSERYEIPLVGVFTDWYSALRLAAAGRTAEAEAAYRAAAARLPSAGMPGLEQGLLPLALLCLRIQHGDLPGTDPHTGWGPYEAWSRPLRLLADGHREQAKAAAADLPDSPRDLLYEARTCLTAVIALEVGDTALMEQTYHDLLPAEGELAGAGSGLLTLGPVARYLGDLATALGRPADAAAHHDRARTLIQR
jgi:DNA-binding SARP family transcriptional activator